MKSTTSRSRLVKFLTLSIDTSLLPSKWRQLNVLEFPSTRFPPLKSAILRDSYLWDAMCEVAEGNKKILFLKE